MLLEQFLDRFLRGLRSSNILFILFVFALRLFLPGWFHVLRSQWAYDTFGVRVLSVAAAAPPLLWDVELMGDYVRLSVFLA